MTNKIITLLAKEKDEKFKWNAVVVLGQIFENVGNQIVSLLGELVSVLARIIKPSSTSPGLKAASLRTIAAALSQSTKLDDSLQKDVLRVVKGCLPDKSTIVHTAAYLVRPIK